MRKLPVAFILGCFSCVALPCSITPMNLYRDHATLISEASVIVLAEAIASREAPLNSCQFRTVRTLKGPAPDEISISCWSPRPVESTTDLSAHNDPAFWQGRMGRVTFSTTCQIMPPTFIVGHKYLLLLGVKPDTKQFEEIVEPNDEWLLFVEKHLQRGEQ